MTTIQDKIGLIPLYTGQIGKWKPCKTSERLFVIRSHIYTLEIYCVNAPISLICKWVPKSTHSHIYEVEITLEGYVRVRVQGVSVWLHSLASFRSTLALLYLC